MPPGPISSSSDFRDAILKVGLGSLVYAGNQSATDGVYPQDKIRDLIINSHNLFLGIGKFAGKEEIESYFKALLDVIDANLLEEYYQIKPLSVNAGGDGVSIATDFRRYIYYDYNELAASRSLRLEVMITLDERVANDGIKKIKDQPIIIAGIIYVLDRNSKDSPLLTTGASAISLGGKLYDETDGGHIIGYSSSDALSDLPVLDDTKAEIIFNPARQKVIVFNAQENVTELPPHQQELLSAELRIINTLQQLEARYGGIAEKIGTTGKGYDRTLAKKVAVINTLAAIKGGLQTPQAAAAALLKNEQFTQTVPRPGFKYGKFNLSWNFFGSTGKGALEDALKNYKKVEKETRRDAAAVASQKPGRPGGN